MIRLRWLVGLLGIVALTTICANILDGHRNAALAADAPADLLKRIETLEARVAMLEAQLARSPRVIPLRTERSPAEFESALRQERGLRVLDELAKGIGTKEFGTCSKSVA